MAISYQPYRGQISEKLQKGVLSANQDFFDNSSQRSGTAANSTV
jgi:hypothetical protein